MSTRIGNSLQKLGGIASIIPGYGSYISAALSTAGALTNRMFGSNIDTSKVAQIQDSIDKQANLSFNASNNNELLNQSNWNFLDSVQTNDIGEDGLFSNKAAKLANTLSEQIGLANRQALAGYKNAVSNVDTFNDLAILANYNADGGKLNISQDDVFTNNVIKINEGGTHSSNPNGGIPIGFDEQGIPNLVEEGEVIFNDYVFSNRLKVPKELKQKYKMSKHKKITFADMAKQISKESEERPNDPISQNGLEALMLELQQAQEDIRKRRDSRESTQKGNVFKNGGPRPTWMQYAPAIGLGAMAITDALGITNKPDYSNADSIIELGKSINAPQVSWKPIGDYLTYNPFDRNYYINRLNAESSATKRAIVNQSAGNRTTALAGLLAADYNAGLKAGALARQAEEYNLEQRQQVGAFNRATNQANAEGLLKAAMANQDAEMRARGLGLEAQMKGYQMKESIKNASDTAKSANLSGLFDSLGNIGLSNRAHNAMVFKALTEAPVKKEHLKWLGIKID